MPSKSCTKLSPCKEASWCKIPLLNCSCQDHVTLKCVVDMAISGLEDPSLDPHMLTSSVSHKVCPNIFVTGWTFAATTPVWHVKCSFRAIWCEDMAPGYLLAPHGPSTLQALCPMSGFKQSGRRKLVSDKVQQIIGQQASHTSKSRKSVTLSEWRESDMSVFKRPLLTCPCLSCSGGSCATLSQTCWNVWKFPVIFLCYCSGTLAAVKRNGRWWKAALQTMNLDDVAPMLKMRNLPQRGTSCWQPVPGEQYPPHRLSCASEQVIVRFSRLPLLNYHASAPSVLANLLLATCSGRTAPPTTAQAAPVNRWLFDSLGSLLNYHASAPLVLVHFCFAGPRARFAKRKLPTLRPVYVGYSRRS